MLFVHAWFMTGRHAPSFQSAFLIVLFLLLLPFLWFSWIFRFCVSCSCVLLLLIRRLVFCDQRFAGFGFVFCPGNNSPNLFLCSLLLLMRWGRGAGRDSFISIC